MSTIQIAVQLGRLGVDVRTLERRPSVVKGWPGGLRSYALKGDPGLTRTTLGVVKAIRQTGCDTVYAFTDYFQDTIIPSFVAALLTRRRLFVNVLSEANREEDASSFPDLIRSQARHRKGFRSLLRYGAFHASRRMACRMGTCVVASHYLESYTRSLLHARRTYVVSRGVEEGWFGRAKAEVRYDAVYSGRFDRSKRVSTLVRAWKIVLDDKPDARLLLIGDAGAELPAVKQIVAESGLAPNVEFAGYVGDRQTLAQKVRSARLFVFPSVKEGFGLVVAEAMAAGLPCILADIAPLREVYGGSAVFAKPDDPSSFAEAIVDLLSDEDKRLDYSGRSESLAKGFTWDAVATRVLGAMTAR